MFFMRKALEESASPEEAEQEFVTIDFVQNALEDGGRGNITQNHFSPSWPQRCFL